MRIEDFHDLGLNEEELAELEQSLQLIGQAVAFYRPQGRDRLRLRCAPYNQRAQHFYAKHGFYKIGEEQGSRVPLDILEKYIGLDRVSPLP